MLRPNVRSHCVMLGTFGQQLITDGILVGIERTNDLFPTVVLAGIVIRNRHHCTKDKPVSTQSLPTVAKECGC